MKSIKNAYRCPISNHLCFEPNFSFVPVRSKIARCTVLSTVICVLLMQVVEQIKHVCDYNCIDK